MTQQEYKEARRWERIAVSRARQWDPILGVVDASASCGCYISIAGDYTELSECQRHGIESFLGNNSTEEPWEMTPQQGKMLATLTSEDYD